MTKLIKWAFSPIVTMTICGIVCLSAFFTGAAEYNRLTAYIVLAGMPWLLRMFYVIK